ncbi:MAG: toll/interleukin-1 receptor domain-containing protein, partial [Candidatus Dadabacteria bacterium]|nr:toll/interleukin-1 receptor domain-containing protein [Candidatus Dadabacteria bacterium]
MDIKLKLPYKIVSYLRRIKIEYDQYENEFFSNIVSSAKVFIRKPFRIYEDFGGVRHDYDVVFFLPASVMEKIDLRNEKSYRVEFRKDLVRCKDVEDEYFQNVFFACENENDEEYRQAVSLTDRPQVNPETLDIWKPGQVRLFISHRDNYKKEARELADALEAYGISSFVAHEAIGPMTTWQHEILKGLETMEIMLTFITDDFHESVWTNQEIGFALARNIPVLSLKLQNTDPRGFVSGEQALKGNFERPSDSAPEIYKLIEKRLNDKKRMQGALI